MKTREQIFEEIQFIFRRELENQEIILENKSSHDSIESWNSVTNLLLINSIEEKYKISIPIEIIFNLNTVGDICDYIYSIQNEID